MRYLKQVALLGILLGLAGAMAGRASAQVRVGIGIGVGPAYLGPAPVCAYGYYPYYPYACAPYGYYGPQWFASGVFIGAGPWFHGFYGRPGFYGRGFYGRPVYGPSRGFIGHGPGPVARGFHSGNLRGGTTFRSGGGFRGAGGFHGGGRR
jgi:hypothetical protein